MSHEPDLTQLLRAASGGAPAAYQGLLPHLYDELKRIASRQMSAERDSHTLQPTALVHEAWFRFAGQERVVWQNRAHFFGVASQAMRRVLIDHARAKLADKRGGSEIRLSLEDLAPGQEPAAPDVLAGGGEVDLIALDAALSELAQMDAAQAKIVELKYFGGLTNEEIAEVVGSSLATVKREWAMARAWLHGKLG